MSTFTENYNLIKPDEEDYYDVTDFNENMDTIDSMMAETETTLGQVNEKIGTPGDVGNNTLFGCLNAGSSFIKSMQTIDLTMQANGSTDTKTIQPVNPDKCLVYLIHLNTLSGLTSDYTLTSDSISASATHNTSTNTVRMRFQIIEFY